MKAFSTTFFFSARWLLRANSCNSIFLYTSTLAYSIKVNRLNSIGDLKPIKINRVQFIIEAYF